MLIEGHYLAELEIHKPMKRSNPFEPKQDSVTLRTLNLFSVDGPDIRPTKY